jgi:homoserine dehydrogenase
MPHYRLALLGFGSVGRAFARLLRRKESELESDYAINFIVTGIATGRHGIAMDPDCLDLDKALALVESGRSLSLITRYPVTDTLDFVNSVPADVLFENSPVNHENGEPAVTWLRTALERGMHAVTANKGPVVHACRELTGLAAKRKRKFYFESTVMDGAPIFSLFRSALPAAKLISFRGILNSTTNLILGRMENGEPFDNAVKYCQQIGLAETDPSADVDGWDSAVKVAALVTVLMGLPLKPQELDRCGIRGITPGMIAAAKADGKRWKLLCSAERDGASVKGRVAPELVTSSSPLYHVEGSSSIIEFRTDTLSSLSIVEGDPGPETTAYGLLADFINAVKNR